MSMTMTVNDLMKAQPATQLMRAVRGARSFLVAARQGSRALVTLGVLSTALLAVSLLMQVFDPRLVTGASTWLKPTKFAASIAIAAPTLAWILHRLGGGRGLRRAAGVITAMSVLELAIITAQAIRGVPSHFNYSTTLNMVAFQVMGAGITIFWLSEVYIAFRAFRHRFANATLGWGIRLGLVTALLGGAIAFAMPRPTSSQVATLSTGKPTPAIGAHAVGVPDGGPGLPGTRWSTEGGDLRVPHFFGLHGLQVLPLAGWWLTRRRRATARSTRLMFVIAAGYLGLTAITLIQALRGQPLLSPDGLTLGLLFAVVGGYALAALQAPGLGRPLSHEPADASGAAPPQSQGAKPVPSARHA